MLALNRVGLAESMASSSGRQVLQRARSFLSSTRKLQTQSNFNGLSPATANLSPRLSSRRNRLFSSRSPVELTCVQSLMPLHSVTASSLLKSMLSSKVGQWGSLSEGIRSQCVAKFTGNPAKVHWVGFATPL